MHFGAEVAPFSFHFLFPLIANNHFRYFVIPGHRDFETLSLYCVLRKRSYICFILKNIYGVLPGAERIGKPV